ncbi:hypothetical protein Dimus_037804 [Dionaea muscipula]
MVIQTRSKSNLPHSRENSPTPVSDTDDTGGSSCPQTQTQNDPLAQDGLMQMISSMMTNFETEFRRRFPPRAFEPAAVSRQHPSVHPDPPLVGLAPEQHQSDDRRPVHIRHGQSSRHPRPGDSGDCQTTPAADAGDEEQTRSSTPTELLVPLQTTMTDQSRLGPFIREVHDVPFPSHFKLPHFEQYDGSTDPQDHIGNFEIQMQLFGVDDAIMCRAFPSTFEGAARRWYTSLAPQSISHFSQLREAFVGRLPLSHPLSCRRQPVRYQTAD